MSTSTPPPSFYSKQKFCWCLTLRQGCYFIAGLHLLTSVSLLVFISVWAGLLTDLRHESPVYAEAYYMACIGAGFNVLHVLLACMLILALRHDRWSLMQAYGIIMTILWMISSVAVIMSFVKNSTHFIVIFGVMMFFVFEAYCIYSVLRHSRQVKRDMEL